MAEFDNSTPMTGVQSVPAAASLPTIGLVRGRSDSSASPEREAKGAKREGEGYILLHTTGNSDAPPDTGDGAYASWMHKFFEEEAREGGAQGCLAVRQFKAARGGQSDHAIEESVIAEFESYLKKLFNDDDAFGRVSDRAQTVILNWHLRATGNPNGGQTGRGASEKLFKLFRQECGARGLKAEVVYTVHEIRGAGTKISRHPEPFPHLLALNTVVKGELEEAFPGRTVGISQVPQLMRSLHAEAVDKIMDYAIGPNVMDRSSLSLGSACVLQQLRLAEHRSYGSPPQDGVLLFGMIDGRHGTFEDVSGLASRLPGNMVVAVAGKDKSAALVNQLQTAAQTPANKIKYIGPLPVTSDKKYEHVNTLDSLAGYTYAISFDEKGYRDNASAMVNVLRAGKILFSRKENETNDALIARAVQEIASIEGRKSAASNALSLVELSALSKQMPRFHEASSRPVGKRLDLLFRNVAAQK